MNEIAAILMHKQVFEALANYLGTKPFNEVREFFDAFNQSVGVTQEQIALMQPKPEEKEEAPE